MKWRSQSHRDQEEVIQAEQTICVQQPQARPTLVYLGKEAEANVIGAWQMEGLVQDEATKKTLRWPLHIDS